MPSWRLHKAWTSASSPSSKSSTSCPPEGASFAPRCHVPVDGVERRIEAATGGRIKQTNFIPLPTAHPLCYGVAYLLQDEGGGVHGFTDLLGREPLSRHLADGYLLQPGPVLEEEL